MTTTPREVGVQLTSVRKRRCRSSLKSPEANPSPSHVESEVFQLIINEASANQYHVPSAALESEEFSFRGEDGRLSGSNVLPQHLKAMHAYLYKHYGAVGMMFPQKMSGDFLSQGSCPSCGMLRK